ncbi:MAG: chemotaxis protein CheX [Opitutaceae bacterium]|nr:chemotaxis protein CheX [Opitutaceae bacterium]
MPTTEGISDLLCRTAMTHAVQEVMRTMLNLSTVFHSEIDARKPGGIAAAINGPQVVGTVGFLGDIDGLLYLFLGSDFATNAAAHLLGVTSEELESDGDEAINDAIGELTNMTVGTFKNQLSDRGIQCKLTIPSILRGSNFRIEPTSTVTRRTYRFDIGSHSLITDLLMKTEA